MNKTKTIITSTAGIAAVLALAGCGSNPPTEIKVELEDGRYASCIAVHDDAGDIEELICDWPDDYTPPKGRRRSELARQGEPSSRDTSGCRRSRLREVRVLLGRPGEIHASREVLH